MVPALLSLTSTLAEKVVPLLCRIVKPANACEVPTFPVTVIVELWPDDNDKVRSLSAALSALISLLNVTPPPPTTIILAPISLNIF